MEFERITNREHPDFEPLFALYQSSFPLHEQRTRQGEEALLANPACRTLAVKEAGAFLGLMALWEGADFTYVEHFAVASPLRGSGVGSRALRWLLGQKKQVVLEIDPPVDDTARRRQAFYQRLGFQANDFAHVHPPYRSGVSGHSLVVMTCPGVWAQGQYEQFSAFLRETVMVDCRLKKR